MSLTIHLIRHGQTDDNLACIIQGQKDTPLNDTGRAQAGLLARSTLGGEVSDWDGVWTSDLSRADETARILISRAASPPKLTRDVRLRERFMSTHQGLSFLNPRPPLDAAAETIRQMEARALDFWVDVVMPLVPKEEEGMCRTIAIISHGAFLKALLIHLAHPSIGYLSFAKGVKPSSLPNTSVTTVRILSGMAEGICEVWGGVGHIVADEGDKVIVVGDLSGGE